jgi:hypothetical protein
MTDTSLDTRWRKFTVGYTPVVEAYCPTCKLTMSFENRRAENPVFKHCRKEERPPWTSPVSDGRATQ